MVQINTYVKAESSSKMETIKLNTEFKKTSKTKLKGFQKMKEPQMFGRPKKPMNAFFLWMSYEEIRKKVQKMTIDESEEYQKGALYKTASTMWAEVDLDTNEKYEKLSVKDQARYKIEYRDWLEEGGDAAVKQAKHDRKEDRKKAKMDRIVAARGHKCTKCEFHGSANIYLIRHMKNVHGSEELYRKCELCSYNTEVKHDLKRHIQEIHLKIGLTCDECGLTTKRKIQLKRHTLAVHQGIALICDMCSFKCTQLSSLRQHTKSNHVKILCDK